MTMFKDYGTLFVRHVLPLIVLVAAGLFIVAMGSQPEQKKKQKGRPKAVAVEVVQAERHTGSLDLVARGVAIPYREVGVAAQVGGEVVFKSDALSPGNYVHEGDLLLRIDPRVYRLELTRLEKELDKTQAELDNLEVKKANAERLIELHRQMVALRKEEYGRLTLLSAKQASSEADRNVAQLAVLSATEALTTAENLVLDLTAQMTTLERTRDLVALQQKRARLDLSRTRVKAPFSGVVLANHVEQNGNVAPGSVIATIEDTSRVEVRCSLRNELVEFLQNNTEVQPSSESEEDDCNDEHRLPQVSVTIEYQHGDHTYRWQGTLSRQDGLGMDDKTRTMPVRIRVPKPKDNVVSSSDPDRQLLALVRGMFVTVRFHCQPRTPLVVLPESVIRPGKTVWVVRDDALQIVPIRVARVEEGKVFIDCRASEVSVGDRVISTPIPNAKNGLAVSVPGKGKKKRPH